MKNRHFFEKLQNLSTKIFRKFLLSLGSTLERCFKDIKSDHFLLTTPIPPIFWIFWLSPRYIGIFCEVGGGTPIFPARVGYFHNRTCSEKCSEFMGCWSAPCKGQASLFLSTFAIESSRGWGVLPFLGDEGPKNWGSARWRCAVFEKNDFFRFGENPSISN